MTMDNIKIFKKKDITSFKQLLDFNYNDNKVYDLTVNKNYKNLSFKNKSNFIESYTKSAVLCLLVPDLINNSYNIILTVRSKNLKKHAGQVSFPGGKKDNTDKSYKDCAFREAKEEVGYDNRNNFFIGKLNKYITSSGFLIQPVVAVSDESVKLNINSKEVSKILYFPINQLLFTTKIKKVFYGETNEILYYHEFDWNGVRVWGATAKILIDLFNLLKKL
jgi:8-oxo-dGTP pyrophosphatase MutT (NUDIX family)